jgi:hypothetical protein
MDNLARVWPELLPMYERLYADRAYLPDRHTKPLRERVGNLARQFDVADRRRLRLQPPPVPPAPAASAAGQLMLILSSDAEARPAA